MVDSWTVNKTNFVVIMPLAHITRMNASNSNGAFYNIRQIEAQTLKSLKKKESITR